MAFPFTGSDARRLRRLLAAIGSGGVMVLGGPGCAESTTAEEPTPMAGQDSMPTPEPSPTAHIIGCSASQTTQSCFAQPAGSFCAAQGPEDGCCNPSRVLLAEVSDGQCCYLYCVQGCCGRPFVVDGTERVADVVERSDWLGRTSEGTGSMPTPTPSSRIAAAWLRDAQMEHASIASFARFALELMAFGAPASMLRAAQQAGLDETRHAQDCFTLARLYGAGAVGPGPLSMDGAKPAASLAAAVAAAVSEGCIGETLAAAVAEEALHGCRDAQARQVLARIAEDEQRHAELSWQFVVWALTQGAPGVRQAAEQAFDVILNPAPAWARADAAGAMGNVPAAELAAMRAAGQLPPGMKARTQARVLREVIAPAAAALLRRAQAA